MPRRPPPEEPSERLIPGNFTSEEMEAAFALQDAGVPHPTIDDAAWARIKDGWEALPRVWGRGPWVERAGEHIARARTTGALGAKVYRVTTEVWGLEMQGTPEGYVVRRGALDALIADVIARWPPSTPEAEQPSASDLRTCSAYTRAAKGQPHVFAARDWLRQPAPQHVALPGLGKFEGPCLVDWTGAAEGIHMTPAQRAAAELLVNHGEDVHAALKGRLVLDHAADRTKPFRFEDLGLREIDVTVEQRDGLAYTVLLFGACWLDDLRAVMHGLRVVALGGPEEVAKATERDGATLPAGRQRTPALATPSAVKVLPPALPAFAWGNVGSAVTWETERDDDPMTTAQARAADLLAAHADEIIDELCDGLYDDQQSFAEDDDFEKAAAPGDMTDLAELKEIVITLAEREGTAYARFYFDDAWRVEHGLHAIMHGTRLVAVGGYGDLAGRVDDAAEPGQVSRVPRRADDGAYLPGPWLERPHDGVVALPFWDGFEGRFEVTFEREDGDVTSAQEAAAAALVEDGDAIRDALLAALYASYSEGAPNAAISDAAGLKAIVRATRVRVSAEEHDRLAYTALSLEAPWRKSGNVTVVMHGARVVALTTKGAVEDAIQDDLEARLRERRAAKAASASEPTKTTKTTKATKTNKASKASAPPRKRR